MSKDCGDASHLKHPQIKELTNDCAPHLHHPQIPASSGHPEPQFDPKQGFKSNKSILGK